MSQLAHVPTWSPIVVANDLFFLEKRKQLFNILQTRGGAENTEYEKRNKQNRFGGISMSRVCKSRSVTCGTSVKSQ